MKRREALKRTSLILGYAVSASAVAGVLSGCTSESMGEVSAAAPDNDWSPDFFSMKEIELIAELSETILPRTETPGAKDANVQRYIDIMIKDHYQLRDQQSFKRGLVSVDEDCLHYFGRNFTRCTPEIRHNYLTDLEEQTRANMEGETKLLGSRPFFAILKELTWIGYFTSELIGEEYLGYDPIPGGYHGCVPIEETGNRNWSL